MTGGQGPVTVRLAVVVSFAATVACACVALGSVLGSAKVSYVIVASEAEAISSKVRNGTYATSSTGVTGANRGCTGSPAKAAIVRGLLSEGNMVSWTGRATLANSG